MRRGGWLNNRPGHRSRRGAVAGHMGSGAEGQGVGGRLAGLGSGTAAEWLEQEIELFRDRRQPYRAAATLRRRFHPSFYFPFHTWTVAR